MVDEKDWENVRIWRILSWMPLDLDDREFLWLGIGMVRVEHHWSSSGVSQGIPGGKHSLWTAGDFKDSSVSAIIKDSSVLLGIPRQIDIDTCLSVLETCIFLYYLWLEAKITLGTDLNGEVPCRMLINLASTFWWRRSPAQVLSSGCSSTCYSQLVDKVSTLSIIPDKSGSNHFMSSIHRLVNHSMLLIRLVD